ncbi:uncharacterized protein LOC133832671 [Humulus lupulus]|uniref:uncharacterized protein LOC133832671 n=1 Tax=Humulus lupulus TaxID=3486 RepID=UPI002B40690D|nr:uncharacterized protein LOC133832671 [Humulus lupulus]
MAYGFQPNSLWCMASNPTLYLLSKDMLISETFMKWKSNINIVLIGNNSKFVVTENEPDFSRKNATKAVRKKCERWTAANNKAKAYMLGNMSKMLRTKMEDVETAYDIMEQLQEMFGHKPDHPRFEATKKYVNHRMAPGQHVHDHSNKMKNYFKNLSYMERH